ncbi:MAG TPA: tetratricopeptide repeat protein [Stellaceae bacterium]|nr:tetratricopeptide repeat protein [Stellaceae bacterium]
MTSVGALVLALASCTTTTTYVDPLAVDGRDAASKIGYPTVMRIGMAARAGGDYPNAVSMFRRAAAMAPSEPVPLVAAGDTLRDMGQMNEAITAYNGALDRSPHYPLALEGLAKAYLGTGRPELAQAPLDLAFQDAPTNPKILLLMGVTADFTGNHPQAQADYLEGLKYQPDDPALSLDLALSLALSENYDRAIATLAPFANGPNSTPRERQTLALIYGLKGDRMSAERLARRDLDPASVEHNLAYYETLRRLPSEARTKAVLSANSGMQSHRKS